MPPQTPQAVQSCHELLLWMIPHLDKFPRQRRYTLGSRLESELIEVLALLVDAGYSRDKAPKLRAANRRLAVCRHLWRLCMELRMISMGRYEHGVGLIDGVGVQVGGWIKAC